jgi:peptidoglycan/LPS O-acetylase OafA/YrhL
LSAISYRPEIDGLRALAVSAVVLFHVEPRWLPGGFTGVDIFFVISGFLITLIIVKEFTSDRFSFTGFWIRRVRRIIPALSVMVLCTLIAGFVVLFPSDWAAAGWHGLSVLGFFANFSMWGLVGDYWGPSAEETPLLHTWSLAIEEQYYLFYPLLLIPILKFAGKHRLTVVGIGTILSLALCLFATRDHPSAAFYLLPTRAWELSTGAILALLHVGGLASPFPGIAARLAATLGLLLIAASYELIHNENDFPGYKAILPVLGAALILGSASAREFPGNLLAARPLVYIGKISYSLYLWHWPFLAYLSILNDRHDTDLTGFHLLPAIILLSILSYHFVETPARRSERWGVPVAVAFLVTLATAIAMMKWPVPDHSDQFNEVVWKGRLYDVTPVQNPWTGSMGKRMAGVNATMRPAMEAQAYREEGIVRRYGDRKLDLVVFGDSHALMWSSTIDRICRSEKLSVSFFAADGIHPEIRSDGVSDYTPHFSRSEIREFDLARHQLLTTGKPRLVIVSARFSNETDNARFVPLFDLIREVGAKGLVISEPPPLPFGDRSALAYCSDLYSKSLVPAEGVELPTGYSGKWMHGNALIEATIAGYPGFGFVDIADSYLAPSGKTRLLEGSNLLYIDDDHLSEYGASQAESRIRAAIIEALKETK